MASPYYASRTTDDLCVMFNLTFLGLYKAENLVPCQYQNFSL